MKRLLQFLSCILVCISATAADYRTISLETLQPPRPGTFMTTTSDSEQDKIPDDSNRLPVNEEVTFINEDYIWQYTYPYYGELNEDGFVSTDQAFFKFHGTKQIGNYDYHCLYSIVMPMSNKAEAEMIPDFNFQEMKPAYYIRQEGQKYYMLLDSEPKDTYLGVYDRYGSSTAEILIYDFDLKPEERFVVYDKANPIEDFIGADSLCSSYTVIGYADIESCGNRYVSQESTHGDSLVTLGCYRGGTLPCPSLIEGMEPDYQNGYDGWYYDVHFKLRSVRDSEGNYLYKEDDKTVGVNAPENDGSGLMYDGTAVRSAGDGIISIYDMSGRKMASGTGEVRTNGLPAGVYVASATCESGQSRMKIVVK